MPAVCRQTVHTRLLSPFTVSSLALTIMLSGCSGGGGGSGDTTSPYALSGQISTSARNDVDSDVNNLNAVYVSNNNPASPQAIRNDAIVQGFASAAGTGGDSGRERFATTADSDDYYLVDLQAGQTVELEINDYQFDITSPEDANDLDLYLFRADNPDALITYSAGFSSTENMRINSDGRYLINVNAFRGDSKYILRILAPGITASSVSSDSAGQLPIFVAGEAIVKSKTVSAASAVSKSLNIRSQLVSNKGLSAKLSKVATGQDRAALVSLQRDDSQRRSLARAAGYSSNTDPLYALSADGWAMRQTLIDIKTLNQQDDVEYASPNLLYRPLATTPNDPYYAEQWHLEAINLPQAWDITTGTPASGTVVVAVIDTGILPGHPDINGKLVDGYDFISNAERADDGDGIDGDPTDEGDGSGTYHGTHVAGIIGALSNNGTGVSGVSWGAEIMPVRMLGKEVSGSAGTSYDLLQALRYAAGMTNDSTTLPTKPADIINLSLGGGSGNTPERNLLASIIDAGIIVVAAAGNESSSAPSYPAAYDGVISVASSDFDGNLSSFSNYGSSIDLRAPGGGEVVSCDDSIPPLNHDVCSYILSLGGEETLGIMQYGYARLRGTSMAAPVVAGAFALAKAVYPALTPEQAQTLISTCSITDQATDCEQKYRTGYGNLDALKLVQQAQNLANGGSLPLPPARLVATPDSLALNEQSSASISISNGGSEAATVSSVASSRNWLSVQATDVDAFGFGQYDISVDLAALDDGYYIGTLTFSLDTGNELDFQVVVLTGNDSSPANLTPQTVQLASAQTNEVLYTTSTDGNARYSFPAVPAGEYRVYAGSDIDADGTICDAGETCGESQEIVTLDQDTTGVDFSVTIQSE